MRENNEESKKVLPGKIFELLRDGRPFLSVGPQRSVISGLVN